jgi:hypothetical protein
VDTETASSDKSLVERAMDSFEKPPKCPFCDEPMAFKFKGFWCPCHPIFYWNEAHSYLDMMP